MNSSCFIPVEEPIRCNNDLKSTLFSIPLATESDPESDRPLIGNLFEDAMSQMQNNKNNREKDVREKND